jgi:DNA uptake protein ComE-like DNA-binding protein
MRDTRLVFPVVTLLASLSLIPATGFTQLGYNIGVLNPNTAEAAEMAAVPGVGNTLADNIVAARPLLSNGTLDELLGSDLNQEEKALIREKLFLPINLNSASDEEIMLVPGMSGKMAHEFDEYRPYNSLDQFRREMGKYVDQDEVARFEQYVFVPMDLNSALDEDFATIPDMSKKMIHEFEEYRPYKSMEQFRREIGKYVDDKELARLERYVEIR